MPVPSNITPETAIEITALPYSVTLDVSEAPLGTGYDGGDTQMQAVWWKYTPPVGVRALGIRFTHDLDAYPDYYAEMGAWTGTPPALVQISDTVFFASPDDTGYVSLAMEAGTTYYFQFTNSTFLTDPQPGVLQLEVLLHDDVDVPAGSLIVNSDEPGLPNVAISRDDASILLVNNLPSGEMGEWLPDGTLAVVAETSDANIARNVEIYDSAMTFVRAVVGALTAGVSSSVSPICSDGVDLFYVLDDATPDSIVRTFRADGVIIDTIDITATLPHSSSAIAVNSDNTVLYAVRPQSGSPSMPLAIARWDLVNGVPLTDLYAPTPGTYSANARDLIVLEDGSVLFILRRNSGFLYHFFNISSAGAVVWDITVNTNVGGSVPRIRRDPLDPTMVWLMDWPNGVGDLKDSRFRQFRISDGTVMATQTTTMRRGITGYPPLWGPSQSCPLLINPLTFSPPVIEEPPPEEDVCITAPPAVPCWNGGSAGPLSCVTSPATPSSGPCWNGSSIDDLQIGLLGEGQP